MTDNLEGIKCKKRYFCFSEAYYMKSDVGKKTVYTHLGKISLYTHLMFDMSIFSAGEISLTFDSFCTLAV